MGRKDEGFAWEHGVVEAPVRPTGWCWWPWMALHPQTDEPTIFVYDGYPGGAGIAELAFEAAARHARATLDLVAACPCTDGCPSCVQSPKCGNWNEYLDKAGAIALLRLMALAPD